MSLYVNGREVTRKELEKNFKTLNERGGGVDGPPYKSNK